uniref:Fibrinogen-related protein n=1 Tax=Littorina littorea TaxID=31216 RepID=A0A0A7RRI2_LITLI|nr:fibrinogen-related protein [Littorina littorea]
MKVSFTDLSLVVTVLWAVFKIARPSESQQDNLFRRTSVKDAIFTKGLLFQDTARSLVGCARKCATFKCCLTFTFNKVNLPRSCRGHSTWNMTLEDNHTHSPGTKLFAIEDKLTPGPLPADCEEAMQRGGRCGVRQLKVTQHHSFNVTAYCDDDWTVFQRRQDGSVDFYRGWEDYKNGFGDPAGEFWLGLEAVHQMTTPPSNRSFELRVDLGDWEGDIAYAIYSSFFINSESVFNYSLSVVKFEEGNAGDSLGKHGFIPFSTKDADNDIPANESCAITYRGAWWFFDCHDSHLNGPYWFNSTLPGDGLGVFWFYWKEDLRHSLKFAQMKFRAV